LGDLILTTPAISAVRKKIPDSYIGLMVSDYAAPLVRNHPEKNGVHVLVRNGAHKGLLGWKRLVAEIKKGNWDAAVLFNNDFFVASALKAAGVKTRIGLKSRVYSPFLYTDPIRQKRSQVKKHEADYGLELLRPIGIDAKTNEFSTKVEVSDEFISKARKFLESKRLSLDKKIVVIHPGMGGSALNWPELYWVELVNSLLKSGLQILITLKGEEEKILVDKILSEVHEREKVILYQDKSLNEVMGLFALTDFLVAPSTGPLHLAVALGVKVIGIYPPIRVQSVLRWGPYLNGEQQKLSVAYPEVDCPEVFDCQGSSCKYFNCMESVSAGNVAKRVVERLGV
jgi:ADP-heptose:LPS heptosyltransferase